MYLQPIGPPEQILLTAQQVEESSRVRQLTEEEVARLLRVARQVSDIATRTRRIIKAWSRLALPAKYGWSGAEFTQWFLVARPRAEVMYLLRRAPCPSNSRSFNGVEVEVEGVRTPDLLMRMGRSHRKVLPLDDKTIAYFMDPYTRL